MELSGTTVLVTGANRGIGRALLETLAREPIALLLAGVRDPARFTPPPVSPGGAREIRPVRMDLSSREEIDACCAELGDELARIDVLVNNAGLMTGGLLEEQDMAEVYAMFQVNLVGVAHLTARILPGMVERSRGQVVNNTSISGYAHFPGATTYAASKAGVVALSESLRRELRGAGVGVLHLVTPGVATDMLEATEEVYGRHMDTSDWDRQEPEEWAAKVVRAMKRDARVLAPGGKTNLARVASRGPAALLDALSARMFSRQPRR
jgi:short-subunit dehydrogenase